MVQVSANRNGIISWLINLSPCGGLLLPPFGRKLLFTLFSCSLKKKKLLISTNSCPKTLKKSSATRQATLWKNAKWKSFVVFFLLLSFVQKQILLSSMGCDSISRNSVYCISKSGFTIICFISSDERAKETENESAKVGDRWKFWGKVFFPSLQLVFFSFIFALKNYSQHGVS